MECELGSAIMPLNDMAGMGAVPRLSDSLRLGIHPDDLREIERQHDEEMAEVVEAFRGGDLQLDEDSLEGLAGLVRGEASDNFGSYALLILRRSVLTMIRWAPVGSSAYVRLDSLPLVFVRMSDVDPGRPYVKLV